MSKYNKNLLKQFITDEFPVSRIKNYKKKWERVIIVPQGYVRKTPKTYELQNKSTYINSALIKSDIIRILINVFGCDYEYAREEVLNYFNKLKI